MIREFRHNDLDAILQLWLTTNQASHHFIPKGYWEEQLGEVRNQLPLSKISVYESGDCILGFIGLIDDYIAGMFISTDVQSQGIGKQLLDDVKRKHKKLTLNVYQKNKRALGFYQREAFHMQSAGIDEHTGEPEFIMIWERNSSHT